MFIGTVRKEHEKRMTKYRQKTKEIKYIRHTLSASGLRPDEEKMRTVEVQ